MTETLPHKTSSSQGTYDGKVTDAILKLYRKDALIENALYVRNLPENATEALLKLHFQHCGEIERVIFRVFTQHKGQCYAQINFRDTRGVQEGVKLSRMCINGVPCITSVLDPALAGLPPDREAMKLVEVDEDGDAKNTVRAMRKEWIKEKMKEQEKAQMKTVHVANLAPSTDVDWVKDLCNHNFGKVVQARVEKENVDPVNGATISCFALVEFQHQATAMEARMAPCAVGDRIIVITAAKTVVNPSDAIEQAIQFGPGGTSFGIEALPEEAQQSMYTCLMNGKLDHKLRKAQAAANEIFGTGYCPAAPAPRSAWRGKEPDPPPKPPASDEDDDRIRPHEKRGGSSSSSSSSRSVEHGSRHKKTQKEEVTKRKKDEKRDNDEHKKGELQKDEKRNGKKQKKGEQKKDEKRDKTKKEAKKKKIKRAASDSSSSGSRTRSSAHSSARGRRKKKSRSDAGKDSKRKNKSKSHSKNKRRSRSSSSSSSSRRRDKNKKQCSRSRKRRR